MAVDISDCIFYNHAFGHQVAVVWSEPCRVEWHGYIGHYASSAIHRALFLKCGKTQTVGHHLAQTVGMHQFARVKALFDVECIVVDIALYIGLLYAAPRRGVIFCNSETYH